MDRIISVLARCNLLLPGNYFDNSLTVNYIHTVLITTPTTIFGIKSTNFALCLASCNEGSGVDLKILNKLFLLAFLMHFVLFGIWEYAFCCRLLPTTKYSVFQCSFSVLSILSVF